MTYAFTHMGNFLLLAIEIWALGLDLGLKAGILASRQEFRTGGLKKGEEEKEEKIPQMCESIGH